MISLMISLMDIPLFHSYASLMVNDSWWLILADAYSHGQSPMVDKYTTRSENELGQPLQVEEISQRRVVHNGQWFTRIKRKLANENSQSNN